MAAPAEGRPRERALAGVPAARGRFPHGFGAEAARDYMSLRDQAWMAVASGDAHAAVNLAGRCLEEAGWLAHRATAELTEARRLAEDAAARRNGLAIRQQALEEQRARLEGERQELDRMRAVMEGDRAVLLTELAVARKQLHEEMAGPPGRKGERAAHRREPEPVLPDHDVSLRPDPAQAQSPAEFMELLRQFRIWAGKPSYRNMAARDQRFTASALHAALGRDVLPARHGMVDAIVAGCGGSEEDRSMWATAWRRLAMRPSSGVALARVLELPAAPESA